jgi:hypothetical protein
LVEGVPIAGGLLEITRTWYCVPVGVEKGIVHVIVPEPVAANVPIFTGDAKLPFLSESCTVNTLPGFAGVLTV